MNSLLYDQHVAVKWNTYYCSFDI